MQFMTVRKVDLSKGCWNQKENWGSHTHSSEIIELKFGKKCHTLSCKFKAFENYCCLIV